MKTLAKLFLLLNILLSSLHAQDANVLQNKFGSYLQNNFQEKVYVHTDKSSYLAGEILWFKIYNVEAFTNRPVGISKVAYIELLDEANKPVLQSRVGLTSGRGEGSLYIPVDLSTGCYKLRCYTNWMKNFDASYFFHKNLSIYNTLKEEQIVRQDTIAKSYYIQFFPEGGNLVTGLQSRVAFRAVTDLGENFDFQAGIINGRNDTILKFKPSDNGLGSFYFRPQKGERYKAWIKPAGKPGFTVGLPTVFEKGTVISLSEGSSPDLILTLASNLESIEKYLLFVHSGQRIVFLDSLSSGDLKNGFRIPVAVLGNGISHLSLFDGSGKALCERLYFKKPQNLTQVSAKTDKDTYAPREKISLEVNQLFDGVPAKGNFSVSVYLTDSVRSKSDDIAVNLWLTSELKGKIENASWYFYQAPPAAIDLLMLTHGWRRFKWEEVLNEKKKQWDFLPEVNGQIVSGKVIFNKLPHKTSGRPRLGFLSVPGNHPQFYTASMDNNGNINFNTKNFYGGKEIIAQPDLGTDSLTSIEIYPPYSDQFVSGLSSESQKLPIPPNLLGRSIAVQVHNAYNSKLLNRESMTRPDTIPFYFLPDKLYRLDDYVRFATMEEVLREYVPEITVRVRKDEYQLRAMDLKTGQYHDKAPLILIDGVPAFDEGNSVIRLDPKKIQRMEIVTSAYQYGRNVYPGILSIHTYKGNLADYQLPSKALALDYDGLQRTREFYSPMYEGDKTEPSRIPDYRTTLFWQADNQTDKDGKAKLTFFASDLEGRYIIEIQSLSDDGNAGSATAILEVVKSVNRIGVK